MKLLITFFLIGANAFVHVTAAMDSLKETASIQVYTKDGKITQLTLEEAHQLKISVPAKNNKQPICIGHVDKGSLLTLLELTSKKRINKTISLKDFSLYSLIKLLYSAEALELFSQTSKVRNQLIYAMRELTPPEAINVIKWGAEQKMLAKQPSERTSLLTYLCCMWPYVIFESSTKLSPFRDFQTEREVKQLSFEKNDSVVKTAQGIHSVYSYDLKTQHVLKEEETYNQNFSTNSIYLSDEFSECGITVFAREKGTILELFSVNSDNSENYQRRVENQVKSIAVHPSGKFFATGCKDGKLIFWSTRPLKKLVEYDTQAFRYDPSIPIESVAFSSNGELLAFAFDKKVLVYRLVKVGHKTLLSQLTFLEQMMVYLMGNQLITSKDSLLIESIFSRLPRALKEALKNNERKDFCCIS